MRHAAVEALQVSVSFKFQRSSPR